MPDNKWQVRRKNEMNYKFNISNVKMDYSNMMLHLT